ncbi:hypothetical protein [Paracoccus aminovorans]|uniref:hypothetical protein n=1 Tax=Paracoccus aminovorans TaxID=34004 RepID=UPI002B258165|nr:hypothetical protein [Paracoccus aminovorans]
MAGLHGFHCISARLAAVLCLCIAAVWPLRAQESGGSYLERTTAALAQLDAAERALAAGDTGGIRGALDRMGATAGDLSSKALRFREVANREFARCGDRVQELERRIGDIKTEQGRVQAEIKSLEATLAGATERERLSAQQLVEINRRMANAHAALEERRRKLDELNSWWWVPGYGAYLGIRTLADHDIEEANSLSHALNDERARLSEAGQARAAADRLMRQLQGQITVNNGTTDTLNAMSRQSVAHIAELRQTASFLTTAEAFWSKASTLLQIGVERRDQDLRLLLSLLDEDLTLDDFSEEFRPSSGKMREALLAFAKSVDSGSNYLLDSSTDYCGGPPRAVGGPDLSTRCNVSQITRYFEIVDPVRCSFRYVNPPGCPPSQKVVDQSPAALQAGRNRGDWTRTPAQNWVGRASTSPCELKGSIYYGKLAGPDQCEAVCQGDPVCTAWTYNIRNAFMPGSIGQCWGAPAAFELNKRPWEGFESGGLGQRNP